jgi:hypothetical protein
VRSPHKEQRTSAITTLLGGIVLKHDDVSRRAVLSDVSLGGLGIENPGPTSTSTPDG